MDTARTTFIIRVMMNPEDDGAKRGRQLEQGAEMINTMPETQVTALLTSIKEHQAELKKGSWSYFVGTELLRNLRKREGVIKEEKRKAEELALSKNKKKARHSSGEDH